MGLPTTDRLAVNTSTDDVKPGGHGEASKDGRNRERRERDS